jgi:hypothetical protein
MSIPQHSGLRRQRGRLSACLIACLAGGCSEATFTAARGTAARPPSTVSPSSPQGDSAPATPAIVAVKSDRDSVLAALKEQGIEVVSPDDIVVRGFRYAGLKDCLEWFVDIEHTPGIKGLERPLRISLPSDNRPAGDGTLDLVLLPPRSTGREGLLVVLRCVSARGGGCRIVAGDAPPIWSGGPNRRVGSQSRLDGGPLMPRTGKTYKLVTYAAREDPTGYATLTLRCKAVKPTGPSPGAAPPS